MSGNRKSIRLKNYDYTQDGMYYVTVCVNDRKCIFGDVSDGKMILNNEGYMVDEWWRKLPEHFPNVEVDESIVMPNHLHGIIVIVGAPLVGALNGINDRATIKVAHTATSPATIKVAPTLGEIIGAFKSITTNEYIRNVKINNWPRFGKHLWQRNFYEHVIRDEQDSNRIREYIINNPGQWERDEYFTNGGENYERTVIRR
ncbi:MAG: transposase [Candidatus Omnitrophica bacterium]|nr:transposase [Candidatus Omnitrophota bacterium]